MGVVALKAKPATNLGMLTLVIVFHNLFMALSTVYQAQPLGMGEILNISMAIDAIQLSVNRNTKFLIIYIEGKLSFSHLLFFGGRNDHLKPLFPVHLEDIAGPMTFETHLIVHGKRHPCPREEG